jgi:hypothetical protein
MCMGGQSHESMHMCEGEKGRKRGKRGKKGDHALIFRREGAWGNGEVGIGVEWE